MLISIIWVLATILRAQKADSPPKEQQITFDLGIDCTTYCYWLWNFLRQRKLISYSFLLSFFSAVLLHLSDGVEEEQDQDRHLRGESEKESTDFKKMLILIGRKITYQNIEVIYQLRLEATEEARLENLEVRVCDILSTTLRVNNWTLNILHYMKRNNIHPWTSELHPPCSTFLWIWRGQEEVGLCLPIITNWFLPHGRWKAVFKRIL